MDKVGTCPLCNTNAVILQGVFEICGDCIEKAKPLCRESEMLVLERDHNGKPTVWCDPEIVPLVKALNDGGVPTVTSCSGHGERNGNIALKDGRELIIANDWHDARRIERLIR